MFSYFEPISLKKILLGKWFFKFWSRDRFREMEINKLSAILNGKFMVVLFV